MAKPTTPADFQYIISDQKEQIAKLKRDATNANFELTNCRKEVERLKSIKLTLEDQVVDYRAEISKWKTLYDQITSGGGRPQHHSTGGGDHQRQLDGLRRKLSIANNERDNLADQLRNLKLKQQRPDNPLPLETTDSANLQRTLELRNEEIRRILKDYDESKQETRRMSESLRVKDDEIARLRQQLIELPPQNVFSPPPLVSPQHSEELHKLRSENRRLSDGFQKLEGENRRLTQSHDKLSHNLRDLEDKNILLHQQNLGYEDDFKREKEERQLMERRLAASKDENRNLQAIIDVVNQGGGRQNTPP